MNFYDVTYLEHQAAVNNYLQTVLIGIGILSFVILSSLYAFKRLKRKYRDLSIIIFLFLLFMFGLQYTDYTQLKNKDTQSTQMINFIKVIAAERHLSAKDVYVNSTQLTDGAIVKLKSRYYQIKLTADQSSYVLIRTHLLTNINIMTEEK
ncbi:DUF3290 domain-containing protein [Periweissella ghanensis]|uniref:DUF3290 domain-containing protein n=1 Tax=Periweissella ghanensis TaxID=467997 RepID=A0ABN8BQK2_9LACO|nr:DUF3290 domain-containing protein [Periweissella ghanensis]MCM0601882.1 DUF3290 domain-containing protein [Periweissella ghanensis]CAH0418868.1 hypothetical protein WGH24286_01311 [Periweissella ghanensis]